jgi:hypothetical protein
MRALGRVAFMFSSACSLGICNQGNGKDFEISLKRLQEMFTFWRGFNSNFDDGTPCHQTQGPNGGGPKLCVCGSAGHNPHTRRTAAFLLPIVRSI